MWINLITLLGFMGSLALIFILGWIEGESLMEGIKDVNFITKFVFGVILMVVNYIIIHVFILTLSTLLIGG